MKSCLSKFHVLYLQYIRNFELMFLWIIYCFYGLFIVPVIVLILVSAELNLSNSRCRITPTKLHLLRSPCAATVLGGIKILQGGKEGWVEEAAQTVESRHLTHSPVLAHTPGEGYNGEGL